MQKLRTDLDLHTPSTAMLTILLTPALRAPAARPSPRASPPSMLARKPFKGGDLGDFLKAGEAEAKYGPKRYAAVSEDLWKVQTENTRVESIRQQSLEAFELQKAQILQDHALLSAIGLAAVWALVSPNAMASYGVGALLGTLYLVLSQRSMDSFGAQSIEEIKGGPPSLIVPVIMVLMVAKYQTTAPWGGDEGISLFPILGGFFTNYLATLAQAFYPDYDAVLAAKGR